jgi:hypothetical protein
MQSQGGVAGSELTPTGRFKLQWKSNYVTVKLYGAIHVRNELDCVAELGLRILASLHIKSII